MSTRVTTVYLEETNGRVWHLYSDLMGADWTIYLRFPKAALEAIGGEFVLAVPIEVWAKLCQGQEAEKYLTISPEALRREAEEWADKRRKAYQEEADTEGRALIALRGCSIADINWPREKQVEAYIQKHTPPGLLKRKNLNPMEQESLPLQDLSGDVSTLKD